MLRKLVYCTPILLLAGAAMGDPAAEGDKLISGMSIVGDQEAPKSLAIVPWKSSDLGDRLEVSRIVDDGRRPVDRDVFMRELDYYQISAQSSPTPSVSAR